VVKAYADAMSGNLIGEGKLTLINNQVTPATGTILAKAIFDNSAKKLWPGQSVAMRIQTALDPSVLVVPLGVVQRGLDGHFVYRVKDSTAEWVAVEVVHQDKLHATIKGVLAGDFLVSVGHSRLKPGSRLQIIDEPQHYTHNALLEPRS
jgi:multidrug efflux pump subunit AcrA (membrane-fusion protein)